jgi:triacylglycerol lipase
MDARLFASPGVVLPTGADVEALAGRVKSVVTVSSPHHGTPLAEFLASRLGQPALRALSVSTIYLLRFGQLPLRALLQMGAELGRLDTAVFNSTLLDHVFEAVLGDFSVGRRRAVAKLFEQVASDQSLLTQLTPASVQLFNATVLARDGVRYGSVVTRSAKPGLRSTRVTGLDPAAQALHAVYAAIYRLASQTPAAGVPPLAPDQARTLRSAYRTIPGPGSNDGIVPTRSQVWGRVIAAVTADHLDVIGHFTDLSTKPPHIDWMTSGSGFALPQYEKLWSGVLDFLFTERGEAAKRSARGQGRRGIRA